MMKILLISPYPPPAGGIAIWTEQYIAWMEKQGHRIDLVNLSVQGKRVHNYTRKSLVSESLRTAKILATTFARLLFNRYDVIHFNTSCSKSGIVRDKFVADIIRLFKTKTIIQCHCNLPVSLKRERTRKLLGKMIKGSRVCLVLNSQSKEVVREYYDKEAEIVPNFLSEDFADVINSPKVVAEKVKTVLFAGHLLKTKGCDAIIEAAKQRPDLEFRFAGHISAEIEGMERTENVVFLGEIAREKLYGEYKNADVFLFPTHTEGFPLAVAEAMAFGLPIITTRVGAIPDMLEECGAEYVEINDVNGILAALLKVESTGKRAAMSEHNRQKVLTEYMVNKVADKLSSIYK